MMRHIRLTLLLLAVVAQAGTAPRWLRLCDKSVDAPSGTRAWEDAPIRADLMDSIRARGWVIRSQYRWENLVSATPSDTATLPGCVVDAGPVAGGIWTRPVSKVAARKSGRTAGVDPATQALKKIWDAMGIESARQLLLKRKEEAGRGVTIAIIDSKFAIQHNAMVGMKILDSWDFVDSTPTPWDSLRNGSFSEIHGTSVAGLIGSNWAGLPGIAPAASFLLYRAEDAEDESPVEEDHLADAIVRAMDHQAQILSISLGYRFYSDYDKVGFHPWSSFDGKTLIASRAATAAARRGALVVVASGNDGRLGGRSIGSPADADSVLAVGAINEAHDPCAFSSWGPTVDGRRKPEVVAFGCDVPVAGSADEKAIELDGSGTSFATPLVSGLAVLAKQLWPGFSGMELLTKIQASADLARMPDSVRGYGLPDLRSSVFPPLVNVRSVALPNHWRPGIEPLIFQTSSAQSGGKLDLVLATPEGRILFRRSGEYQTGAVVWEPVGASKPRSGVLLARWSGEYGAGSQTILVLTR